MENRSAFDSSLAVQTARLKELQLEYTTKSDIQNTVVLETIVQSSDTTRRQQIRIEDEVKKVSEDAARLRLDMLKEFNEIKALIRATAEATGEKQQKHLKEKATKKSASWVAKDIIYSHLMVSNIRQGSSTEINGFRMSFELSHSRIRLGKLYKVLQSASPPKLQDSLPRL